MYKNGLTINISILRCNILRCYLIKRKILNEYTIRCVTRSLWVGHILTVVGPGYDTKRIPLIFLKQL